MDPVASRTPRTTPHAHGTRARTIVGPAACELQPGTPDLLNTLGVARYRAGLFAEAIEALERADELNTRGAYNPADDQLFIAMALHRLGDTEAARSRLAECEQHLQGSEDPISLAFLREAKELIEGR